MSEPVTVTLNGFDPNGEPELTILEDGGLQLLFNFMPPSDAETPEEISCFDDFDVRLQTAIGASVVWEDRELFLIPNPNADTLARLKIFVESYRTAKPSNEQALT